ncbi:hypothetical protein COO20_00820 [Thalassospira marina]|uniref:Uncharacterized protein n=1 Tax=Thalassospira marina TaxID=2048283 RepID=A0A2N3KZ45_9PROT|nr:hypothetical protein COO20_00820 [Thalassospira marina]
MEIRTGRLYRIAPILPFIKAQLCPILLAVCYHGDGFTASIRVLKGTDQHTTAGCGNLEGMHAFFPNMVHLKK